MNMIDNIQLWELNRWADDVCKATQAEFRQLHQEEQAQQPASFWEQKLFILRTIYRELRSAARQGLPSLERYVVHRINPQVRPESLLPDAPVSR